MHVVSRLVFDNRRDMYEILQIEGDVESPMTLDRPETEASPGRPETEA
jgi:hypothetical protein